MGEWRWHNAKRATITGTISKIDWINPHIYIQLDARDEQGAVTAWRLESPPCLDRSLDHMVDDSYHTNPR